MEWVTFAVVGAETAIVLFMAHELKDEHKRNERLWTENHRLRVEKRRLEDKLRREHERDNRQHHAR